LIRQRILASSRPPGRWSEGILKVDSGREKKCVVVILKKRVEIFETMEFAYQEILSGPAMLPHHYIVLIYSVIERACFAAGTLSRRVKSEIM
jgi:hypothetical protein